MQSESGHDVNVDVTEKSDVDPVEDGGDEDKPQSETVKADTSTVIQQPPFVTLFVSVTKAVVCAILSVGWCI